MFPQLSGGNITPKPKHYNFLINLSLHTNHFNLKSDKQPTNINN